MADLRSHIVNLLDRWRQAAVLLACVVAVNVLLLVLVIRPMVRVSGDSEAILATRHEEIGKIRSEVSDLERIASKLACARSEVHRVYEELLSSKTGRMTAIQRELRFLARERGLDPERITYAPTEVKGTGLVRFEITFPLEGTYETLEQFIGAIESSDNFLIVQDIKMDQAEGQRLELQVNLITYFQAPETGRPLLPPLVPVSGPDVPDASLHDTATPTAPATGPPAPEGLPT